MKRSSVLIGPLPPTGRGQQVRMRDRLFALGLLTFVVGVFIGAIYAILHRLNELGYIG